MPSACARIRTSLPCTLTRKPRKTKNRPSGAVFLFKTISSEYRLVPQQAFRLSLVLLGLQPADLD